MKPIASILVGGLAAIAACSPGPLAPPPGAPPEEGVAPSLDPLIVPGGRFQVAGVIRGPKGLASTTEILTRLLVFSEDPLPGMKVTMADAQLHPIAGAPTTVSDAQGRFRIAGPAKAGFIVAIAASASAPLAAYFKGDSAITLTVASTMVASKIATDAASHSASLASLDPAKIDLATQLVAKELLGPNLKPDYSLDSWPRALDFYTYRYQGALAAAFNAIIPGSVAPKLGR